MFIPELRNTTDFIKILMHANIATWRGANAWATWEVANG